MILRDRSLRPGEAGGDDEEDDPQRHPPDGRDDAAGVPSAAAAYHVRPDELGSQQEQQPSDQND